MKKKRVPKAKIMADYARKRSGSADNGERPRVCKAVIKAKGPQEEEGRVKTKPISCSTVGGEGTAFKRTSQHLTPEDDDEDEASENPPAPCKISKIGLGMSSQMGKKSNPISIKLGATKPKEPVPSVPPKKPGLASVFNEDDDSEPEEMPPEAKMRMKNIGRETPTSAGPNSFNKGKHGFSDNQRLWERKIKSQTEKS